MRCSLANSDSHPKVACVSKQACELIGKSLGSGKAVLMQDHNNKVSILNGTSFEPVTNSEECQDTLSDDEVAKQLVSLGA